MELIQNTIIKLPVDSNDNPNWLQIEKYINHFLIPIEFSVFKTIITKEEMYANDNKIIFNGWRPCRKN